MRRTRRGVPSTLTADRRGASLVEYIILVGTIALFALAGFHYLNSTVDTRAERAADCIASFDGGCSPPGANGFSTASTTGALSSSSSTQQQSGAWYWTSGIARGIGLQLWDDVKGLATLAFAATPPGFAYYGLRGEPNPAVETVKTLGKLALWATPPMQLYTAFGGPDPIGDAVRQAGSQIKASWQRDKAETLGRGIFEVASIVVPLAKARAAGELADVARVAEGASEEANLAREAELAAARTVAREGSVASRYFSAEELAAAHPTPATAIYHGVDHTREVADMAERLALARGLPADDARFLGQVATVHDWDPARVAGTPARVKATLQALNDDFNGVKPLSGETGSVLRDRFGWTQSDLNRAEALIQRTEFPFDAPHGAYPGTTPANEYQRMVSQLPAADQDFVLREGPVLSEYADKGSGYMVGSTQQVEQRVEGLSNEIAAVTGKQIDMKPGTAGFIDSVGQPGSFTADTRIATELGRPAPTIPLRDQVFDQLPSQYRDNFNRNLNEFKKYQTPPPAPAPTRP